MQITDESELIDKSLTKDTEAYGQLVDRYKQAIYYHCFAIVRDEDMAEDMAQEAFITAYYQLNKYDSKFKFSTWLFKISTNKCLDYLRSTAKQITASEELLGGIISTEPVPHRRAEESELHEAVDQLRPQYRAVISLHYWQGLEYNDIAMAMDAPVNSVRVWLMRAKRELRKELS